MLFYAWLLFGAASVPVLDGIGIFPKPWESDGLLEADIDAIVAATGVDIGDMWIIDTGAEISMAKGANARNAEASIITDSIVIDGSNPGPKSAITHEIPVDHDCGTIKFGHCAVGPSKYNIVSTNDMGTAGISVLLSAADPQCQTMLLFCAADPSGNSTVAAVRVGGLCVMGTKVPRGRKRHCYSTELCYLKI